METTLPRVFGVSLETVFVVVGLALVIVGTWLLSPRNRRVVRDRSVSAGWLPVGIGLFLEVTAIMIEVFTP